MRVVVIDGSGLKMESVIPVDATVDIEEEVVVVEVVVGGRLEDGMGVEVEGYAGMMEDEGGADCTDFVALPLQTN